jgi:hypothetical protein
MTPGLYSSLDERGGSGQQPRAGKRTYRRLIGYERHVPDGQPIEPIAVEAHGKTISQHRPKPVLRVDIPVHPDFPCLDENPILTPNATRKLGGAGGFQTFRPISCLKARRGRGVGLCIRGLLGSGSMPSLVHLHLHSRSSHSAANNSPQYSRSFHARSFALACGVMTVPPAPALIEVGDEVPSPFTGASIDALSIRANWLRKAPFAIIALMLRDVRSSMWGVPGLWREGIAPSSERSVAAQLLLIRRYAVGAVPTYNGRGNVDEVNDSSRKRWPFSKRIRMISFSRGLSCSWRVSTS